MQVTFGGRRESVYLKAKSDEKLLDWLWKLFMTLQRYIQTKENISEAYSLKYWRETEKTHRTME